MGKCIKAGFIAGIVLFIWSFISWMALPWHNATLNKFDSEVAVAQIVKANVKTSGIYILPSNMQTANTGNAQPQPVIFASIVLEGMQPSMTQPLLISLASQILAAILVAWLLVLANRSRYLDRLLFVVIFAVAATIVGELPLWNWFGFGTQYTLVNIADLIIGWLLAGLVLAKMVRPEKR